MSRVRPVPGIRRPAACLYAEPAPSAGVHREGAVRLYPGAPALRAADRYVLLTACGAAAWKRSKSRLDAVQSWRIQAFLESILPLCPPAGRWPGRPRLITMRARPRLLEIVRSRYQQVNL